MNIQKFVANIVSTSAALSSYIYKETNSPPMRLMTINAYIICILCLAQRIITIFHFYLSSKAWMSDCFIAYAVHGSIAL